ncbi:MAG: sigma 54-interacting transcriptional regulator, partial [Angelakisella sp.]
LQGKLLRVLQQKEITPIGSNEVRQVDVRIITATNRDLRKMMEQGTFRQDLFYRMNVVEIKLPPLRERKQDILLICRHFLSKFSQDQDKECPTFSHEAERILLSYNYPGNIRELSNAVEYAVILSGKQIIGVDDLPPRMRSNSGMASGVEAWPTAGGKWSLEDSLAGLSLAELEHITIKATLARNNGRQKITAEQLGISERGLRYKLQEYGLIEKQQTVGV